MAIFFCLACSDLADIACQASRWFPVQTEAAKSLIMMVQITIYMIAQLCL
jgi:hypothetical protein